MNLASLALGFVFAAIAMPFLGQAKKETDPVQKRNKSIAGALFLMTGLAFFLAFAISALGD